MFFNVEFEIKDDKISLWEDSLTRLVKDFKNIVKDCLKYIWF